MSVSVVFVHGLFSSRRAWAPMTELLTGDPALTHVTLHHFEYDSRVIQLRPDRRIPHLNDIADRLHTYLRGEFDADSRVVLVTHSQGGLVVQRFLARTLARGGGAELAPIRRVVMFACPNSGSEFLGSLRRLTMRWRNPQERELRPLQESIIETHRAVARGVVEARRRGPHEWPIPLSTYAGMSDNIVPPAVANWTFPLTGVLDGDHFTVIRPANRDDSRYKALRAEILAVSETPGAPEQPAADRAERAAGVSVEPPVGRLDSPLYGREELIGEIMSGRGVLTGQPPVHVLHGLAGSGKSHVALEVARRFQRAGRLVWWVQALRLSSGMREVASQLGAPASLIDRAWSGGASATDLVWRFLNDATVRWVLIIDNVDQPGLLAPDTGEVGDGTGWLRPPASSENMVVVTTRDGDPTRWPSWTTPHAVQPLGAEDGALVLLDRAGTAAGTAAEAGELSRALGGLPLALRAVGDYLKSVHTTRVWQGDHVLRDYGSYRSALHHRFELPPGDRGADLDEPRGLEMIRQVFDISLDLLAGRGLTQAGNLLRVLACLNVAPVPYHVVLNQEALVRSPLFTELTGQQRLTVLEGLAGLAMIEPYEMTDIRAENRDFRHVLTLHPLVHGMMRNHPDIRRRGPEYYSLIMEMLTAAVRGRDPDAPDAWQGWDLLAPHTVGAVRDYLLASGIRYDRRAVRAALELGRLTARYLLATGLTVIAEELLAPVVAACGSYGFDPGERELLALRHELARSALEQHRPAQAEKLLRGVIEGREAVLGANDADTLASRHKLARAIMAQNRWAEAEAELRAIVEAEREVRGPEHSDTMVVRHSLARAVLLQRRTEEAEAMLREVLAVRLRLWAPDDPETLFVRQSLGRCLYELDRLEEADREVRNALDTVRPEQRDRDRTQVLWLRWTWTQVLLAQGRTAQARAELSRLWQDRRRVLGEAHPETLETEATLRKLPAPRVAAGDEDED
ncbi:alpha/beta hydrolase [Micromonospora okii]|uniref:alpha/beta hydrolase n=1 Tax=Micromonospora okii TaxID=1182970 RepID=UPI001E5C3C7F|nr:alpha/beta fold hydrolase [Micromonospora okii]